MPLTDQQLQSLRNLGNDSEAAADEIVSLRAERNALMQTLHNELGGHLRLRELGGALTDEPMTQFVGRVIAERDRLREAIAASCEDHRANLYEAGPGGGCELLIDAVAAERNRWAGVEEFLKAAADGSVSRNNSESMAAELLVQIRGAINCAKGVRSGEVVTPCK